MIQQFRRSPETRARVIVERNHPPLANAPGIPRIPAPTNDTKMFAATAPGPADPGAPWWPCPAFLGGEGADEDDDDESSVSSSVSSTSPCSSSSVSSTSWTEVME